MTTLSLQKRKTAAPPLTLGTKKRIWKLFYNDQLSIQKICTELGVTYWQVYRIINGQVKLNGKPRSDKGKSRTGESKEKPRWTMDDFEDLDDFAIFTLMEALEQSAKDKTSAAEKVKLVRDVNDLQTKIMDRQLIGKVRRADAEVIARVIKRFKPDADYNYCVQVYTEEFEKYMREKK